MLKYLNIRRGFTIIEVTIALFLLSTGILAAFAVTQHIVIITETASSRLIAAYLAQEGVEIVRNIRDTNWLKRRDWKTGIIVGNREADFRDTALTPYAGRFLNIAAGFYSYAHGPQTKFRRKITITTSTVAGRPRIGVSVLVEWLERGQTHQLRAKGHLHNWRFK
ncbi:MAG: prepilin-type N-terminal cleavage/methylation domain-containing protein [Candidatus Nealsonbacteria bacterium]|nr:prepilin-type N-terminal cleavage/methylation domain-containing protein [Candidatus Nealsonbacteria bacterium]